MSTRALPPWRAVQNAEWLDAGVTWGGLGILAVLPVIWAATLLPHHALTMALAALGVIAVLAAIAARPERGALVLIVIVWWNASDVVNMTFGFAWILRLIMLWTFLAWGIRRALLGADAPRLRLPLLGPVLGYAAVLTVSAALADFPTRAFDAVAEFLKDAIIVYLVINLLPSPRKLLAGVNAILLGALLVALPVAYQGVTGTHFEFWGFAQVKFAAIVGDKMGWRAAGSIGDPNFLAMIMVAGFPLAAVLLLERLSKGQRLFALTALTVCALATAFTYSRGSLVGIAFVTFAMAAGHKRRDLVLAGSVLVLIGILFYMPKEYSLRLLTLRDVNTDQQRVADSSYRGRLSELKVGLEMFKDHPLLGVGPGNYAADYQKYNAIVGLDERHENRDAHNLFVQTAAESGVLGLAAFVFMLGSGLWATWRVSLRLRAAGATRFADMTWALEVSMGVYLLLSFFLHGAYFRHFMLLFALAALAVSLAEQTTTAKQSIRHRFRRPADADGVLQPERA